MEITLEKDPKQWLILDEVTSTNTFLLQGDFPSGTVCLAHSQSAGRGQYGRSWAALKGDAFLFSALLRIPQDLLPISYLPLLSGVAVVNALHSYIEEHPNDLAECSFTLQLKWPNDIYMVSENTVGKLGGILIESRSDILSSSQMEPHLRIVLGIGINWRGTQEDLNALKAQVAAGQGKMPVAPALLYRTSCTGGGFIEEGGPLSFTPCLLQALNYGLGQLQNGSLSFLEEARVHFYLTGRLVRCTGRVYRVKGLSNTGGLLLEDVYNGKYQELYTADERLELL